jgi:hypothetical protein
MSDHRIMSLRFPPVVYVAGYGVPDLLPYHFDLQSVRAAAPFLTPDLQASPTSLLQMVRGDNHDKRPWSNGSSHGSQSPPSHRMRTTAGLDRASMANRLGTDQCR